MATEFEKSVLSFEGILAEVGDLEELYAEMIAVIDSVWGEGEEKGGLRERKVSEPARDHWYTRLAVCITQFVVRSSSGLTLQQLEAVCARKQTIAYIFSASGYRGMAHLVPLIAQTKPDGTKTIDRTHAAVIFAFTGIDDIADDLLQAVLIQPPRVLLVLLLGWLNTRAVLSEQGESNRTTLLSSGQLIRGATVTDADISQLVNAWMYTSYAASPRKHHLKKDINYLIRTLIDWPAPPVVERHERTDLQKPLLVIIHERFHQVHAMYRCYAPSIRDLQQHFRLIAVAEERYIDDVGEQLFETTIKLGDKKNLKEIADRIAALDPDMVYYPSLGMSHWTVVLAQLRLAPIQIMTHGHPATSMSDEIDYAYIANMSGDVAELHSEKVFLGPDLADFEPHQHLPEKLPDLPVPTNRQVRIAVNSKVMKLSAALLTICNRLMTAASTRVEFVFFPGERGVYFDGLEAAIKMRVPGAQVIPYCSYGEFLSELCTCDIALAAFPFGNTNSTVDTCLLGIPTVAHHGLEGHSQSDRLVIQTAGLADWLICDSDESYFETALELIDNPKKREEAMNGLTRDQIYENFFGLNRPQAYNPFADVFAYVYENHESLQASGERIFSYQQLLND